MLKLAIDTIKSIMPTTASKTKAQGRPVVQSYNGFGGAIVGGLLGGYAEKPDPGTYATYRRMRSDPTIALARATATAPIKAAEWSVEARDDASDLMVDAVTRDVVPLVRGLVRDMCYGIDYGWQPFEVVWGIKDGRTIIEKMKALLPDLSEILLDKASGAFVGVRNTGVDLDTKQAFVYSHDAEAGDLYGRSRHENIREWAWKPSQETQKQTDRYVRKAAGVIPIVHHPVGTSTVNGTEKDNNEIAKALIAKLGQTEGIGMPTEIHSWAQEMIANGAKPSDVLAWKIEFLEVGADHSGGLTNLMRYFDSLKFRGWLVPERTALEGQHGTLAESSAHADIGLAIAGETLEEMQDQINHGVVDLYLVANFGERAGGAVRLVAGDLIDQDIAFRRGIISQILTNPTALETAQILLDIDALLDTEGLPKAEEVVDPNAPTPDPAKPSPTLSASRGYRRVGTAVMGRPMRQLFDSLSHARAKMAKVIGDPIVMQN